MADIEPGTELPEAVSAAELVQHLRRVTIAHEALSRQVQKTVTEMAPKMHTDASGNSFMTCSRCHEVNPICEGDMRCSCDFEIEGLKFAADRLLYKLMDEARQSLPASTEEEVTVGGQLLLEEIAAERQLNARYNQWMERKEAERAARLAAQGTPVTSLELPE